MNDAEHEAFHARMEAMQEETYALVMGLQAAVERLARTDHYGLARQGLQDAPTCNLCGQQGYADTIQHLEICPWHPSKRAPLAP